MMNDTIRKILGHLNHDLVQEIISASDVKEIPKDFQILKEGQYVKSIPIVIKGSIKVFLGSDEKELLLYYIKPAESCIMLLNSGLNNEPSKIFAVTEEDSVILTLPIKKVEEWIKKYPDINILFMQQYTIRYHDMLNTIHTLLFEKMDSRLYKYLKNKISLLNSNPIKLSHKQIALELGTAREVISRVIKRLENEGKVQQTTNGIKVL